MSDSSHKPVIETPAELPPADGPGPEAATESLEIRPELLRFDQPTIISQRGQTPPPSPATMTPSDLGRVLVGERLGHFELEGYVGGGGMGAVFRAQDTQLGRTVALKVLSRDQSNDEETLRRFRNEAQSAARLDHENIARVYFFGEDRGLHFIVFEFIEGINARDLVLRGGPLSWADALNYTLQVADALAHASSRDVVHRDIKPSNIIITESRRAKLVDMGLARLHQVAPNQEDLTASGVTLGTFDYISPEQARDPRSADVRSDLYSLGCTLYFMLTGQPPFPQGTVLQKLLQHQGDEPPDPRQFNAETPPELCAVIRRLLAKDPRKRYQTPATLMADLLAIAAQHGIAAPERPLTVPRASEPPPLSPWERHLPWIVPVAGLIVAALAVEFLPWPGTGAASQAEFAAPGPPPSTTGPSRTPADLETGKDKSPTFDRRQPVLNSEPSGGDRARSTTSGGPAVADPRTGTHDALATSLDPLLAPPEFGEATQGPAPATRPNDAALADTSRDPFPDTRSDPSTAAPTSPGLSSEREGPAQLRPSVIPAPRPGVFIVSETQTGPQVYPTLSAACTSAPAGGIIELHYDGPRPLRPVRLTGAALTIRAGAGYRPQIVFAAGAPDTIRSTAALFSLAGGELRLVDVSVSLHGSAEAASVSLALVELEGGAALRVEHSVLTSACPGALDDSFARLPAIVRVVPPARNDLVAGRANERSPAAATIELADCIVRGEATLVDALAPGPLRLSWDNGLAACSGRLLHLVEDQQAATGATSVDIELRKVTIAVAGGLALVELDPPHNGLPQFDFRVQDCIVKLAAGASLLEQTSTLPVTAQQQLVNWDGARNYYEGVEEFWRIRSGALTVGTERLNFNAWQKWWGAREDAPHLDAIAWRGLPAADKPAHQVVPADYAVDASRLGSGAPAGMSIAELPVTADASAAAEKTGDKDGMGMPPLK